MMTPDKLTEILNRLKYASTVVYDVETSGLEWLKCAPVGHVLTFGPAPSDTFYVPIRHAAGGNIPGAAPLTDKHGWDGRPSEFEGEMLRLLNRPGLTVCGHHLNFDLKFLWRLGVREFDARFECTMVNAALIDELQPKFSLDYCAQVAGVVAKKGAMIYEHIRQQFPDVTGDEMAHFWRLAGDDPAAVEYAEGDGATTWQLRTWQMRQIHAQELERVHDIESRLIPVLIRMSCEGIRIDEDRLRDLDLSVQSILETHMKAFPEDFNVKSPLDVEKWCRDHGQTDWPLTPKKGRPSFPEKWLLTHEAGRQIVAVRKYKTLMSTFIAPMRDTHMQGGRVHADFHQLRSDEFGTVTGRLSCSGPNLQQCVAKGTRIMVPGGTRAVEDVRAGDLVYSFDSDLRLVLKPVAWAGWTGTRRVVRVHWRAGPNSSEPYGYLDLTPDHPIRLRTGEYIPAGELVGGKPYRDRHRDRPSFGKIRYKGGERVLAVHRSVYRRAAAGRAPYFRNALHVALSGQLDEARFVFELTHGFAPEEVDHIDGDSLNDVPGNLRAIEKAEHSRRHAHFKNYIQERYGYNFTYEQLKADLAERGSVNQIAAKYGVCHGTINRILVEGDTFHNHTITHLEYLVDPVDVYDLTVPDTENFIANELCVHNCPKHNEELGRLFRAVFTPDPGKIWGSADYSQCEPRLLAIYSRCRVLLHDYRTNPQADSHTAVANASGLPRQNAKQMNMSLINGAGINLMVTKFGLERGFAEQVWNRYFEACPEIGEFRKTASAVMHKNGYVKTLLGRRCRLKDPSKDYVAVNRILQGGNADILKWKMVQLDTYLRGEGRPVRIMGNIHDSIDYEFPEEARPVYQECLRWMEDFSFGPFALDVPMRVDAGEGPNWAIATYGEPEPVAVEAAA